MSSEVNAVEKKNKSEYFINAVGHALDILELFQGEHEELSFTALNGKLKLSKNSMFRLLATLESRHYIERNNRTGEYRLGLNTLSLGQTYIKQAGVLSRAKPELARIVASSNETSTISVRSGFFSTCLDASETSHPVRVTPRIGFRFPLHCTSAGKVLLAHMSRAERDEYFSAGNLERYTKQTITDVGKVKMELQKIFRCGYAVDRDEYDEGVSCVGAPFRKCSGEIAGVVCVTGPSPRFTDQRIESELVPLVICAARAISEKLGYSTTAIAGAVPEAIPAQAEQGTVSVKQIRAAARQASSRPSGRVAVSGTGCKLHERISKTRVRALVKN